MCFSNSKEWIRDKRVHIWVFKDTPDCEHKREVVVNLERSFSRQVGDIIVRGLVPVDRLEQKRLRDFEWDCEKDG